MSGLLRGCRGGRREARMLRFWKRSRFHARNIGRLTDQAFKTHLTDLDLRLVLFLKAGIFVVKIDPTASVRSSYMKVSRWFWTHTTVSMISSSFIFLTVASQSSVSIGFSPFVNRTIFLVHVFLLPRNRSCVSIATMRASIAVCFFQRVSIL